jgi:hypothetical protein
MDCIDPRPPAIDREDTAAEDDRDGSEDRPTRMEGSEAGAAFRRLTCSFRVTRLRIISVDRTFAGGNYKLKLEDGARRASIKFRPGGTDSNTCGRRAPLDDKGTMGYAILVTARPAQEKSGSVSEERR